MRAMKGKCKQMAQINKAAGKKADPRQDSMQKLLRD